MFSALCEVLTLVLAKTTSGVQTLIHHCSFIIASLSRRPTSDSSLPMEVDTLGSPNSQVLDLTHKVKTLTTDAVALGGFSDVYCGEWKEEVVVLDGVKLIVKHKVNFIVH
jgi:hypothetical protein